MSSPAIWFWQQIISPHMVGLAVALAQQGREVVFVVQQSMSRDRADQGWSVPSLGNVSLELARTAADVQALAGTASSSSIHICQGIRANGLVGVAQQALAERGLRQWMIMETVDDAGLRGFLKRLEYRRLFLRWRQRIEGVLATGYNTASWVVARGMRPEGVYPFAYFLPQQLPATTAATRFNSQRFRFVFVGQFIQRKRLDALIAALASLQRQDFELAVIGTGPMEQQLREMAGALLPDQVDWIGRLPLEKVQEQMANADCLILPSRHDGWGAVVSEALMVGTPVICSDTCGAAGVVQASGVGGVFSVGDIQAFVELLLGSIQAGKVDQAKRVELAAWAQCLGAQAGAEYLQSILAHRAGSGERPLAPWVQEHV